ncbi:MAG TPA: carboxylating nicotinate-nucleotide diphosphorylase [Vicinamibacterales bacterium]|nr:carboxylating nicotinate-nucleotide diphosphorylase [Vicinamibacterales bacterium]
MSLDPAAIDEAVVRALAEDIGSGDVTTRATVGSAAVARAVIAARRPGVLAGIPVALRVFERVDPAVRATATCGDGARVARGDVVMQIEGPARGILTAERVVLNFLGHLSGIATATADIVAAVAHTAARVCDTRKTTPGLRAFEKYAVRCGGGVNHRMGLYDQFLIKDNHIAAAGGIANAVSAARAAAPGLKLEVEVETLEQLDEALNAGVDQVLLDNMDPVEMKEAVTRVAGRAVTEASGSITLSAAAAIAETGVDLLSVGWITHSAPSLDFGLDFLP